MSGFDALGYALALVILPIGLSAGFIMWRDIWRERRKRRG